MNLALKEALGGWGRVSPNPLVGCVIVDGEHRFVASGYHAACGGPHAEIEALQSVKDPQSLRGATMYVSLEPCAHQGRTPSCAKHLSHLGLARVVCPLHDPNPLVSGKGFEILRAAGIQVELASDFTMAAEELAEQFLHVQRRNESFVALKVASTLDGFLGDQSGESKWLTSEEARSHSRYLRSGFDAVVVGVGTFLSDNPRLDLRLAREDRKNKVIVLDPKGRGLDHLEGSQLLEARGLESIFWVTDESVLEVPEGLNHIRIDSNDGRIPLKSLVRETLAQGLYSLFVEGGATTLSRFLAEGFGQRLYQYLAPDVLGGHRGRSWTEQLDVGSFAKRLKVHPSFIGLIGRDLFFSGRLPGHSAHKI